MPTETTTDTKPSKAARRKAPRLPEVNPPNFRNDYARRTWFAEREAEQARVDAAWDQYPPGTTFFVQSREIKSRTRAGVQFTNTARVKVTVSDLPDTELAEKVKTGAALVSPVGAKLIEEDGELAIFASADVVGDMSILSENDRLRARIAELEGAGSAEPKTAKPKTATTTPGLLDAKSQRATTGGKPDDGGFGDDEGKK